MCYACGEKATVTDHLMPHKGNKELFEKTGNHIPLCATCHNTVSAKFDTRYVVGEDVSAKAEYLAGARAHAEIMAGRKFPAVKVIPYR